MKHFRTYTKSSVLQITKTRKFETKIGERIFVLPHEDTVEHFLQNDQIKYVLLGIPEDIGVRANAGVGGTDSLWVPFLTSFLNVQCNDFMEVEKIGLLGAFDFGDIQFLLENTKGSSEERLEAYRSAVASIDEEVEKVIKQICASGKIPIVIGGGHNNAYPIIKGVAKGLHQSGKIGSAHINTINLDAHTDFRVMEGRHSGNPFRFAMEHRFLNKYSMVGIHENYLPQSVWMDIRQHAQLHFTTFEDIFIREKFNFHQAVMAGIQFVHGHPCGVELDVDAIENALSSASTPSGVSSIDARRYMHWAGSYLDVAYLHICEGAVQLTNGNKCSSTAKLIGYLVSDFLKAAN